MRITKINIPKSQIENGLEAVKMHKLGQVVLLAGKNGAGKSRLLNLIIDKINSKPQKKQTEKALRNKEAFEENTRMLKKNIESYNKKLERYVNGIDNNESKLKIQELENAILKQEDAIKINKSEIERSKKLIDWDLIETTELKDGYTIVPFVPKSLNITPSINYNKSELIRHASSITSVGVERLHVGTFARIQVIQDRWFNATHQNSSQTEDEKKNAIGEYDKLKDLVNTFLDTDIKRDINGEPTIFGLPLSQSNISDGQKILLQLCLAIHCQEESLDELILFLDEPENHLHPSVLIQTIERLIEKTKNGQIWISTHSIPLLSYFDPSNIWFLENNKISYAGSVPEKVLNSLLGDENQIGKLQDFISLPSVYALNRHAFECLFHPESVNTEHDDPQSLQIRSEIKKHLKEDNKIRILDFGAGKGRLLANIIDGSKESKSDLIDWLDYIAFDKFDLDKVECLSTLERVYKNPKERYYNDFSELFSKYDKESFDVVIMCNVLHEISPNNWLSLFSSGGDIPNCLSDNGILLVVEDQQMPIGEKAYQKGFIVLNTSELKELFGIKETDTDFGFSDARGDGRLKAHRIKKEYLTRISSISMKKALKTLNINASNKIIEIRDKDVSYKNGKIHGFWLQQFANTGLALKELE